LYLSALEATDGIARRIGCPGNEVERTVYYVTIEPSDRLADAAEDNLMCDKLIHLINVEPVVGSRPQSGETAL